MKRFLYFQSPFPLSSLSEACLSLTPKVTFYPPHQIFLEISATQRLFGGEGNLLFAAEELVATFIKEVWWVLTDRPEWAPALATEPEVLLPPGKSQERLGQLPLDRLEYCGDPALSPEERKERRALISFMKKVGLQRISDFTRLSPAALNRRFGKKGAELQSWALGKRELPLPIFFPSEPLKEILETEDIYNLESLLFLLRQGLIRLEARLEGRARMAKQIRLTFILESRQCKTETLTLSEPLLEAQSILKLLREKLNSLQWDSPLQRLEIEITDTLPWTPGQLSLWDKSENRFTELAQYVARLKARFGESQVGVAELQESYVPERSWKNVWPPKKIDLLPPPLPQRPLFLFNPPKACEPPKHYQLIPSENLATEWWDTGAYRRYFIAHTPQGERLWLYLDCQKGSWFIHGTFD
jgi:protein ImuB